MDNKELIDRGFDTRYSAERTKQFCEQFADPNVVQDFVNEIHIQDHTFDMKRGEFYPEILRCISSLKNAAADAYKILPTQCHHNFGSNGNIDTLLIAMKLREVNRNITTGSNLGGILDVHPTYFRNYNSIKSKQLKMLTVPLKEPGWSFDVDGFIDSLKQCRPTAAFLITPHNPTGMAIPDADIIRVLEEGPPDIPIIIDRTLANINEEVSTLELLKKFKNRELVVLHSFSKYYGLSHLRVGISLFSNEIFAEEIRPLLPLGLVVEAALRATVILSEGKPLAPNPQIRANILENKNILTNFCLKSRKFRCTDFVGNYCLLFLPDSLNNKKVVSDLEKQGIYTMGSEEFSSEEYSNIVRLHTGGRVELMQKTVDALEELYGSKVC